MSEILKSSRLYPLLLATALILSQFIILGCCDSDSIGDIGTLNNLNTISDANSLIPATGSIASVGSFDKHSVVSYGNGPMGLASNLETGLTQTDDGSVLKSRNLAMLSYGSELMNINDFSSLSGTDTLGNEFGTQSEKTVTLKNCIYPFALMKEDLTTVSGDGTGISDASKTLLILPDAYSAADLAMFNNAFGDSGNFNVKTLKYTFDIKAFFDEVGLFNLSAEFNMKGTFGQLSAVINEDIKITQEMIRQKQAEDEAAKEPYDPNQWDSNGGVTCYWTEYK
jgi:hypothetical protein